MILETNIRVGFQTPRFLAAVEPMETMGPESNQKNMESYEFIPITRMTDPFCLKGHAYPSWAARRGAWGGGGGGGGGS